MIVDQQLALSGGDQRLGDQLDQIAGGFVVARPQEPDGVEQSSSVRRWPSISSSASNRQNSSRVWARLAARSVSGRTRTLTLATRIELLWVRVSWPRSAHA